VELRALCDEVPRTPPGPEGSNGTGITSCAAEYPKFLSSAVESDCFFGGVIAVPPDYLLCGSL
jgi:hypothetical protein